MCARLTNEAFRLLEAAQYAGGGPLGWGQPYHLLRQVLGHRPNLEDVKLLGVEEICRSHARLPSIHIYSRTLHQCMCVRLGLLWLHLGFEPMTKICENVSNPTWRKEAAGRKPAQHAHTHSMHIRTACAYAQHVGHGPSTPCQHA